MTPLVCFPVDVKRGGEEGGRGGQAEHGVRSQWAQVCDRQPASDGTVAHSSTRLFPISLKLPPWYRDSFCRGVSMNRSFLSQILRSCENLGAQISLTDTSFSVANGGDPRREEEVVMVGFTCVSVSILLRLVQEVFCLRRVGGIIDGHSRGNAARCHHPVLNVPLSLNFLVKLQQNSLTSDLSVAGHSICNHGDICCSIIRCNWAIK